MAQFISDDKMMEVIFEQLPKTQYSFLLCRIKNMHLVQYLYGKECRNKIYKAILHAFLSSSTSDEYIYHLHSDHFIMLLKTQDPYRIIHRIYAMDDALTKYDEPLCHHKISLAFGIYFLQSYIDFYQAYDYAKLSIKYSKDIDKYNTTFDFYDQKGIETIKQQFILMSQLEEALNNHEFEIYLQPKVDAITHVIKGAEALIRWVRQGEEIPLRDFMPMIDKNAFIRRIDLFVFEEVCKLLQRWKQANIQVLPISVNISKSSFEDGFYYVKEILRIHQAYMIDKHDIEFELSEGICFKDNHRLHRFFNLMKEHGYTCSLDDFGSGYSSFISLTYLPIQIIKLDSSFCLGTWDKRRKIIVKHVLTMLLQLNFHIVIEGVETKEIAQFFHAYPNVLLQGFYFSKPLCIEEFENYYRKAIC